MVHGVIIAINTGNIEFSAIAKVENPVFTIHLDGWMVKMVLTWSMDTKNLKSLPPK